MMECVTVVLDMMHSLEREHALKSESERTLGPPGHSLGPGPMPAQPWALEVISNGSNLGQSRLKLNAMFAKLRSIHERSFGNARSHSITRARYTKFA